MISCPVCRSTLVQLLAPYRNNSNCFSAMSLQQCRNCELVFASPMPAKEALAEFNSNYFSNAHSRDSTNLLTSAFFSGIARLRLAFLNKYLSKYQILINNVLEIGPGPGFFVDAWLEQYSNCIYYVVESDSTCFHQLKSLGAQLLDKSTVVKTDLVVLSHVLEHVSDPIAFISVATKGLREGCPIFIEVPCRDWEHKAFDEPHLLFFDKNSMHILLSELGFEDIEISYHGKTIEALRSQSWLFTKLMAIRMKLISLGFVSPFASRQGALDSLPNPLQRAVVSPFLAHRQSTEPAWWLRAVARKKNRSIH